MKLKNEADHMARIGAAIKRARKRRRMTALQVARSIGVAASVICELERGHRIPSGRMVIALADALGASADELLGLNPKPPVISNVESRKFYDGVIALIDKLDIPKS